MLDLLLEPGTLESSSFVFCRNAIFGFFHRQPRKNEQTSTGERGEEYVRKLTMNSEQAWPEKSFIVRSENELDSVR